MTKNYKILPKIAKNWLILLPKIPGLPDRITRNTRYDKKVRVTRVPGYQSLGLGSSRLGWAILSLVASPSGKVYFWVNQ